MGEKMSALYKNKSNGMIFGVCAGIAEYTGISTTIIRLAFVFASIFSGSLFFWVYLLLGILLPNKNDT